MDRKQTVAGVEIPLRYRSGEMAAPRPLGLAIRDPLPSNEEKT